MRNTCWPHVAFAILLCVSVPAEAQEPSAPEERLVMSTLERNPGLQGQKEVIESKKKAARMAGTLPDPMAEVSLNTFQIPWVKLQDALGTGIELGFTQVLPPQSKRKAARSTAEKEIEVELRRLRTMENELSFQVRQAIYEYAFTFLVLENLENNRQVLENSVRAAEAAYASNRGNLADILTAQREVTRNRIRREEVAEEQEVWLARLDGFQEQVLDRQLLLQVPFPEPQAIPPVAEWLDKVSELSPSVLASRALEDLAESRVQEARLGHRPDFLLGAGLRIRDMSMDKDTFFALRAGMTLPFFHRRDRYQPALESSQHQRQGAARDTQQAVLNGRTALAVSWRQAEKSLARYRLYRDGLMLQAQLAYDSAVAAYGAQKADFSSLMQSLVAYYDSRQEMLQNRKEHWMGVLDAAAVLGVNPATLRREKNQ